MRAASMRGRVTHLPKEGDRATKPPPRSAFVPKQETRASFPGGAHRPQHRSRSCLPWRPPLPRTRAFDPPSPGQNWDQGISKCMCVPQPTVLLPRALPG